MWPFKKKQKVAESLQPGQVFYGQVDSTERFGDNLTLSEDEWINTTPLNANTTDPQSIGLPPVDASGDDIYRVADGLSRIRESIPIPDGQQGHHLCRASVRDCRRSKRSTTTYSLLHLGHFVNLWKIRFQQPEVADASRTSTERSSSTSDRPPPFPGSWP